MKVPIIVQGGKLSSLIYFDSTNQADVLVLQAFMSSAAVDHT
jgi:hypothetical protein